LKEPLLRIKIEKKKKKKKNLFPIFFILFIFLNNFCFFSLSLLPSFPHFHYRMVSQFRFLYHFRMRLNLCWECLRL